MTQENKFAIIIGFAVLLVVGILVSDHLAEVARGAPGSLVAIDPVAMDDQRTIEYLPLITPPPPAPSPEMPARGSTGEASASTLPTERGLPHPVHVVTSGETLSGIAHRYYGNRSLATALSSHNGLPNPNDLREGLRLIVPPSELLAQSMQGSSHGEAAPPATVTNSRTLQEYEVRAGDTLSELAQHLMGSARHTDRLLELNRDRLSSIADLRIGIRLRYPASANGFTP